MIRKSEGNFYEKYDINDTSVLRFLALRESLFTLYLHSGL